MKIGVFCCILTGGYVIRTYNFNYKLTEQNNYALRIDHIPFGFFCVKFQLSAHILSISYCAVQPKSFFALSVFA